MGSAERVAVPRLWPGATIVCLGGGPSLTREDVDYCRGRARVVAVNDAYRLAPWADVLYACDAKWWAWHQGVPTFTGLKYALERQAATWPGVQVLENTGHDGLEPKPTGVKTGRNSGYQAINVAVHLGAARIVLLGYDMMRGPKDLEHWFGNHPNGQRSPYLAFAQKFACLVKPLQALGVEVINCSRRTALTVFPRQSLELTLPDVQELAS
jgi:hypothetical protein